MNSVNLIWSIVVAGIIYQGCNCSNSTQNATEGTIPPQITTPRLEKINQTLPEIKNITEPQSQASTFNQTNPQTTPTTSNSTTTGPILTNCPNPLNSTCIEESWNNTLKTNYTTVAEAIGSSEEARDFRLPNWAAIAAGVFLVSATLGYFSCVGYRRYLLKKYGNSQILIGEEVYDTTDLRNFEI